MGRTISKASMIAKGETARMLQREAEKNVVAEEGITLTAELMEGFVKRFLAEKFDGTVPTPPLHREMWTDCCSDSKYVAWAAPRGHAKSTSITLSFTLAACLFRFRDFVLIVSDTWGQSVEFLRDIKTELNENEALRDAFKIKRFLKDSEDDVIVQCEGGHKFRIVARGSEQKVRGLKWNNKRPNLILGDDLEGDEQVESKLRRDKFFKWFMKALLPCGADNCLFRVVGTVLHFDSALERILKNPTWKSKRYQAHKSFSDFSNILWPEKFSEDRLRDIRQNYINEGESDGYSCEYLNQPVAEGDSFFDPSFYLEMDESDKKRYGTYYVGWDMAVSTNQRADFTVGTVFKIDSEGFKHIVDVRRGRWDALQIVDEMFSVQEAYQPAAHFGEKGPIDSAIAPFLDREMLTRQKYLNLVRISRTKDKMTFAKPLQAMMKAKHVKFDKDMGQWPDVEEELRRFPKGAHDDIIDALAIVGQGLIHIASVETPEELEEEDYRRSMVELDDGRSQITGY
jgi:predicted phage terminase large subunit-like protein